MTLERETTDLTIAYYRCENCNHKKIIYSKTEYVKTESNLNG
jgi:DNA-directed RNA polymerase subunit RPC12/RpoP